VFIGGEGSWLFGHRGKRYLISRKPARDLQPTGLLLNAPRPDLLRLMPALNVTRVEIDRLIELLQIALGARCMTRDPVAKFSREELHGPNILAAAIIELQTSRPWPIDFSLACRRVLSLNGCPFRRPRFARISRIVRDILVTSAP
jgi:hypothetical protein